MKEIPLGSKFWPTDYTPTGDNGYDAAKVVAMYEQGFAGAWRDVEALHDMRAAVTADGGQAFASGITTLQSGAGKLSLLFPAMLKHFPGCLPGPAQVRGSCVADCSKNAALASVSCEIEFGKPDEITGLREGVPELSADGVKNGVIAMEYLYWFRGHNGDGWDCGTAAKKIREFGMLLRKNYPDLGFDLTKYSGSMAGKYGRTPPPTNISSVGKVNVVRTTTEAENFEEVRDLLHNGYGISSCGSEGFSNQRDANGVSNRKGSWSHAMSYLGVDDRDEIKSKYGEPLILVCNSWGTWNSGGTRILGTSIDIPPGCFWAKWTDVKRRTAIAYSSVAGWPSKTLPDYGLSVLG